MADASPAPIEHADVVHTLTGDVRTHDAFHSRYVAHDRTLVVYLPPGYDAESAERYPVLYLHDGQNVFDRATSFGEEWQVDESAQRASDHRGHLQHGRTSARRVHPDS
jgi:predicted alpha/beta superfamily hydrolase